MRNGIVSSVCAHFPLFFVLIFFMVFVSEPIHITFHLINFLITPAVAKRYDAEAVLVFFSRKLSLLVVSLSWCEESIPEETGTLMTF